MKPLSIAASLILGSAMLLTGCGGGTEATRADGIAASARAEAPQAAPTPSWSDLLAWAPVQYPAVFAGVTQDGVSGPYNYRYYPVTGNYLALQGDGVYLLGPASAGRLQSVGTLASLGCRIFASQCAVEESVWPNLSSQDRAEAAALMTWAEAAFPQLFRGVSSIGTRDGYSYRFYADTQNYLAVKAGLVYLLGPASGGRLQEVGSLFGLRCQYNPSACTGITAVGGAGYDRSVYLPLCKSLFGRTDSVRVTAGFDNDPGYVPAYGTWHPGVDCVNDATDQTFYALARGTVLVAGDDNFASCPGVTGTDGMNTIAIYDEAEGRTHLFLHASAVSVRRDEEVEVGTALGTQGSTGAEGSHVHYEIRNEKTCFAADKTRSANLASYKARNTDPLTWFSGTGASSLPGVPSGLRVVSASRSGILLNWSAVSATTQYRMYRNGVLVASLPGTSFTDAGLTADTAYSYTVAACNATACSGVSSSVAARTDSAQTQLPAAPAIPAVASANESSVSLIWTGVSGASSYWVYRNSTRLVQVSATSYTDTTLAAGTAYQYAVAACSAVGCSAVSPSVTASTQAGRTSVPQVPAGLSTPSVGASNAQLAWTAATGAASYVVYRNGVQIASPSAGSYSDVGLSPTTDYVYTVAACNSAGCSAQGAVLNVRTLAAQIQAPIPPTAPTIAGATASALSLSWQAVTGSSYYRVLRNGQFITTALTTAYLDSGLSAGTAYTYTVAACNAAGCSAASPAGTGATAAQAARVTSITAFNYNVSQARMYSQLLSGNNSVFAVLGTNLPSTALIEVAGLACNIAAPVTATGFAQVGSYSTAPRSYLGAFGATVYNYSSSSGASQGFIAVCQGTAMSRGATYDVHVKDASGGNHITGGYLRATVN